METFVVRVWTSADVTRAPGDGRAPALRGRVEHVRSGRVESFHAAEHLLGFMRQTVDGSSTGFPTGFLVEGMPLTTEAPKGATA